MTGMKDQLGDTLFTYPLAPGFKASGTSQDAARAMRGKAATLRERVFDEIALAEAKGLTADQVAARDYRLIGDQFALGCRSSVSSAALCRRAKRRRNDTGLRAAVWRAKMTERAMMTSI